MAALLIRDELARLEGRILQQGKYFRPEIRVCRHGDRRIVVKDCACMQSFLRFLMGRRSANREVRIYQRLQGIQGIPAFLGVIDRDAFAIEFVEGETLARQLGPDRVRKALADLERVIQSMHERSVVHLDLKQKRNIIVQADDSVCILDFQSAFYLGRNLLKSMLFSFLKRRDLAGLIKFKAKYIPDALSPSELKFYKTDKVLARLWPFTHLVRWLRKLFGTEKSD
ncbi:MAG: RIO1 family regulatory kinase/ATPase domain-containing protein [Planctomycetota bacterium]|jgi:RIO-like serine/threonine protein kinase